MTTKEKIQALRLALNDNEIKAANGDLNAMRESEAIRDEINRLQSGRVQENAPAQGHFQLKRQGKGTATATLQRITAVITVIYGDTKFPRSVRALARAAVERAHDLGLPGVESMDPGSPAMREVCKAILDGIAAVENDDKPS
jgi:hypothetical protein